MTNEMKRQAGILSFVLICAGIGSLNAQTDSKETTYQARIVLTPSEQTGTTASNTIEEVFAFNDLMNAAEKTSSSNSENVNGKIEDKFAFNDLMKEAKLISSFAGRKFFVKLSSDRLTVALDGEDNVVEVFNVKKTLSDKDSSVLICEDGQVIGLQKRNGQLYVTFPGGIEMELSEY